MFDGPRRHKKAALENLKDGLHSLRIILSENRLALFGMMRLCVTKS